MVNKQGYNINQITGEKNVRHMKNLTGYWKYSKPK